MAWLLEFPGLWITLSLALYGLACAVEHFVMLVRRWTRAGLKKGAVLRLVVLIRNQEEQVEGFVRELRNLLHWRAGPRWECVLVDLASTDQTTSILERLVREEVHMHLVRLPTARAGQALEAVLMLSQGGVCLLADLQAPAAGRQVLARLQEYW